MDYENQVVEKAVEEVVTKTPNMKIVKGAGITGAVLMVCGLAYYGYKKVKSATSKKKGDENAEPVTESDYREVESEK